MSVKSYISVATLAAVSGLATGANAQNLLANGSFENPIGTEWSLSGNLVRYNGGGFPFNTSDGLWAISWNGGNVTPNGILEQAFTTAAGSNYDVSFDFGKWFVSVDFPGTAALRVQVMSGGTVVLDQTVSDSTGATTNWWTPYSYTFTATSSDSMIRFSDASSGTIGFDGLLDNVRVVPSPSAAALLGLGGLMAAGGRRRRGG